MERAPFGVVSVPMVQMPERTLSRRPVWDLPNHGPGSASLLALGPADRIGPLAHRAAVRRTDRIRMSTSLAACALVAGLGTAAMVRPWRSPPPPIVTVRPLPAESAPSVPPPPVVSIEPPPPAVIAATAPPNVVPEVASPSAKAPERVAPAGDAPVAEGVREEGASSTSVGVQRVRRDGGSSSDRAAHPSVPKSRREVRSIRRPRPAAPTAEVEETGSSPAKPRAAKPTPSKPSAAPGWNLPSVLRPGGF